MLNKIKTYLLTTSRGKKILIILFAALTAAGIYFFYNYELTSSDIIEIWPVDQNRFISFEARYKNADRKKSNPRVDCYLVLQDKKFNRVWESKVLDDMNLETFTLDMSQISNYSLVKQYDIYGSILSARIKNDTVFSLDMETGKILWKKNIPREINRGVYFHGDKNRVYAFYRKKKNDAPWTIVSYDRKTGKKFWQQTLEGGTPENFQQSNKSLVLRSNSDSLLVLNKETGEKRLIPYHGKYFIYKNSLLFIEYDSSIVQMDMETFSRKKLFSLVMAESYGKRAALYNDNLIYIHRDQSVRSVTIPTGKEIWKNHTLKPAQAEWMQEQIDSQWNHFYYLKNRYLPFFISTIKNIKKSRKGSVLDDPPKLNELAVLDLETGKTTLQGKKVFTDKCGPNPFVFQKDGYFYMSVPMKKLRSRNCETAALLFNPKTGKFGPAFQIKYRTMLTNFMRTVERMGVLQMYPRNTMEPKDLYKNMVYYKYSNIIISVDIFKKEVSNSLNDEMEFRDVTDQVHEMYGLREKP
ncbi:MAG: PQQ-binding-like beta-propeller repeat protein [bacterium]|nr:PQQ-binding-like beta-propeller repeat protein [bacterium]